MNPHDLVLAAMRGDDLSARQFVKDAKRAHFSWAKAPAPDFADRSEQAVYAGLVEVFASREGARPPAWTKTVGPAPERVYLVPEAYRRMGERTPAPLKERNVLATGQYLDVI